MIVEYYDCGAEETIANVKEIKFIPYKGYYGDEGLMAICTDFYDDDYEIEVHNIISIVEKNNEVDNLKAKIELLETKESARLDVNQSLRNEIDNLKTLVDIQQIVIANMCIEKYYDQ